MIVRSLVTWMCSKPNNRPHIWGWFTQPMYCDLGEVIGFRFPMHHLSISFPCLTKNLLAFRRELRGRLCVSAGIDGTEQNDVGFSKTRKWLETGVRKRLTLQESSLRTLGPRACFILFPPKSLSSANLKFWGCRWPAKQVAVLDLTQRHTNHAQWGRGEVVINSSTYGQGREFINQYGVQREYTHSRSSMSGTMDDTMKIQKSKKLPRMLNYPIQNN